MKRKDRGWHHGTAGKATAENTGNLYAHGFKLQ